MITKSGIQSPHRAKISGALKTGIRYHHAGEFKQAEAVYQKILIETPDNENALHLMGLIAYQRMEYDRASDFIKRAIEKNNSIAAFHYNLGIAYKNMYKSEAAVQCYREALLLNPEHIDALNNLGNALRSQAKLDEAMKAFSQALEIKPDFNEARSNLLFTMLYPDNIDQDDIYKAHRNGAQTHEIHSNDEYIRPIHNIEADQKLNIGYISSDFRFHSVGFFIEPILEAHDHSNFKIFCYSNVEKPDNKTEKLYGLTDKWHDIKGMSDQNVAKLIRDDNIHILVDLNGHTSGNRLTLFALKPAPVQVTYLGYPNTTGLSSIDYRITDDWADPAEQSDKYYTEELIRLPEGFLCYRPPGEAPPVGALPSIKNDYITFGSFNNIAKISFKTVELWSAILNSVPDSCLLLKSRYLADDTTRSRLQEQFKDNGISPNRIKMRKAVRSLSDHLAHYHEADIALDTFPYNGTTTTCEALWMGVPVITLAGTSHASRVGVSILSSIGMTQWIALSPEQYIAIALKLAGDLNVLKNIRIEIRDKMRQSTLTDAGRFTPLIENSYRRMWQAHIKKHKDFHISDNNVGIEKNPDKRERRLHIGGKITHPDWEILNIKQGKNVDHVGDAKDLSCFPDETFSEVYASHILEHFDLFGEVLEVLKGWHRVIKPGGKIYISVPDMEKLAKLFINKDLSFQERVHILRVVFGGHVDENDYHYAGFNREILEALLSQAGFVNMQAVDDFGLFKDTSTWQYLETAISLNISAQKPENTLKINGNFLVDNKKELSFVDGFKEIVERVYKKRESVENLSYGDLMIMLSDTILDQSFFQSKNWNWRFGGVRYSPADPPIDDPEKILILEWPAAIGDSVMAVNIFQALREKYPGAKIHLLGTDSLKSIYQHSGLIDTFLDNPLNSFIEKTLEGEAVDVKALMENIISVVKSLASENFDLLVNLQILPMSAILTKLACAKKNLGLSLSEDGMPVIHGNIWHPYLFGLSANLMRTYNKLHRGTIFKRLVGYEKETQIDPTAFISENSINNVQDFFETQGVEDQDILIGLSPMASYSLKQWDKYDRLINAISEKYGARFILFGSASEKEGVSKIIASSGVNAIPATHFNLNELMAALIGCDLFISNDTGPMHLACLLKRKTIALFGPTNIREVGPWNADFVALESKRCNACSQSTCRHDTTCMEDISLGDVLAAVDYFIKGDKEAPNKISPNISWHTSLDSLSFSDDLDKIVSDKYQAFFKGQDTVSPFIEKRPDQEDKTTMFCVTFKEKIEKALRLLKDGPDGNQLKRMNDEISTSCRFLKNIIVLNDFKYLDKRLAIREDKINYSLYYQGILDDIELFMSL